MKHALLATSLFISSISLASQQEQRQVLRQFNCQGTYKTGENNQQPQKKIAVKITDFSVGNQSEYLRYLSEMDIGEQTFTNVKTAYIDEESSDIELTRDTDPAHDWAGIAFYSAVSEGSQQEPHEKFFFVTFASKEQIGEKIRKYTFAAAKALEDQDDLQTIAEGELTCTQI